MQNRYAGYCLHCGKFVDKQKGHFHRYGKRWHVRCNDCIQRIREESDEPGHIEKVIAADFKRKYTNK